MDFEELKKKSRTKVLFRGRSGNGKTKTSCEIVLDVLEKGGDVKYIDTESEGSSTLVNLIEERGIDHSITENLEYKQVNSYEEFTEEIEDQEPWDLVVIDTLDHKHSFALKGVTDAKMESDADWNEYAQIYSAEKEIMEKLGKPDTNIIATLDPDSGKMDKPKGAQTNVHGYFSIVVDLNKSGDEWTNKIANWVGKGRYIGASADNLEDAVSNEILTRTEVEDDE